MKYLFILIFFFSNLMLFAQSNGETVIQRCHSDEIHEHHYNSNPDYRHWHDSRQEELAEFKANAINNAGARLNCVEPIIVPVAIHYEGVTVQDPICLRDIALGQLERMNTDFGALNSDISKYDDAIAGGLSPNALAEEGACILFCLADQNHPAGFDLEDGDFAITINQNYTINNSFPNFTLGAWSGYFNIFVTEGTGVLGYSPLFGAGNGDGIVIEACAFGRGLDNGCGNGIGNGAGCIYPQYDLGRTSVHEAGHYFGLPHVWGSALDQGGCNTDDGFTDTPNSINGYFGCPAYGTSSCNSVDMTMNYMDYVNDDCMFMFSEQQANTMYNRANQLWNTSSNKCSASVTVNDASIVTILYPQDEICGNQLSPRIRLRNTGSDNLTSVTINYNADNGGGNGSFNWVGNLEKYDIEEVELPPIPIPSTNFVLTATTVNPNTFPDENPSNDTKSRELSIINGIGLPFAEDFEDFAQLFPPNGIMTIDENEDEKDWDRRPGASAYGTGVYSAYYKNFDQGEAGELDWMILPIMTTSSNAVEVMFDYSYTYFQEDAITRTDSLIIYYADECTQNWKRAWADGGAGLATANPTSSIYIPTANDWSNKSININTSGYIQLAFVNKSGEGNNLYIDNINVVGSTSANNEIKNLNNFIVSPNPVKDELFIDASFDENTAFNIRIHDNLGRSVFESSANTNDYSNRINMAQYTNGIYFVSLISGNSVSTKKVILSK